MLQKGYEITLKQGYAAKSCEITLKPGNAAKSYEITLKQGNTAKNDKIMLQERYPDGMAFFMELLWNFSAFFVFFPFLAGVFFLWSNM